MLIAETTGVCNCRIAYLFPQLCFIPETDGTKIHCPVTSATTSSRAAVNTTPTNPLALRMRLSMPLLCAVGRVRLPPKPQ